MIWWASQPSRGRSERAEIAELAERHDWLENLSWRITKDMRLVVDFEIRHLNQAIPLSLSYPSFYPDTPPQVSPREDIRLSDHQYGAGGELCLEYRPDNWLPEMTGAMMIESAYRLLSGEQPSDGEVAAVANAHRTSVGQQVRNSDMRLLIDQTAKEQLLRLPHSELVELGISEHYYAKHFLAHPTRLGPDDAPLWSTAGNVKDSSRRKGYACRLPDDFDEAIVPSYLFLETLSNSLKLDAASEALAQSANELPMLIVHGDTIKLISVVSGAGSRAVYNYRTVELPADETRLSEEHGALTSKSVAVVGCGSVGSKVAVSLARSGVTKFTLIDGDLLLSGNLVRNELDKRAVGLNKPDALAARIREINPDVDVIVRKLALGGQESSAATDSALRQIAACDLIIDATADSQIFNLCSSVARVDRKPMIWGEVFAGGIGGLVVRSRPSKDPPPQLARRQISAWCEDRGVPWLHVSTEQYDLPIDAEKPPLVADDADVGVIAAHMTRMAIDSLVKEESAFPYSAYAIGMAKEWIFAGPFDAWPIDLVMEGEWGPQQDANQAEEFDAFFEELFPSATIDEA